MNKLEVASQCRNIISLVSHMKQKKLKTRLNISLAFYIHMYTSKSVIVSLVFNIKLYFIL